MEFLKRSASKLTLTGEAWRVGEVLAELESGSQQRAFCLPWALRKAEEERRILQESLEERQRVADLLEAQQNQVEEREALMRERAEIVRKQRLGRARKI